MMETFSFQQKWADDMAAKYSSNLDSAVQDLMPRWLRARVKRRAFAWSVCSRVWAWWVDLEIRVTGSLWRRTEVWVGGRFVCSIER